VHCTGIALQCIVLELHCSALYCHWEFKVTGFTGNLRVLALCCSALYWHCTAVHCTCTAVHCTGIALQCIVLALHWRCLATFSIPVQLSGSHTDDQPYWATFSTWIPLPLFGSHTDDHVMEKVGRYVMEKVCHGNSQSLCHGKSLSCKQACHYGLCERSCSLISGFAF
jgi:hypothetical protein